MSRLSHPQAMQPHRRGRTRTAPPVMPDRFPAGGRYLSYMAFGGMSLFFLATSLLVLRAVYALQAGPEAWQAMLAGFANPIYVAFHVLALLAAVYTGWRFMIRLFGKAQPPKIGPLPRPPVAAFPPLLLAAWLGVTVVLGAVLWGVFP